MARRQTPDTLVNAVDYDWVVAAGMVCASHCPGPTLPGEPQASHCLQHGDSTPILALLPVLLTLMAAGRTGNPQPKASLEQVATRAGASPQRGVPCTTAAIVPACAAACLRRGTSSNLRPH